MSFCGDTKQETTSTWFGLFTQEGEETQVMDMLIKTWSGSEPDNKAPSINNFQLNAMQPLDNISAMVHEKLTASVEIFDPDSDIIHYDWKVIPESKDKKTGG